MNKKTKLAVLGGIVGLLAVVVIYVNFFRDSGSAPVPAEVMQEASKAAVEASKTETPPPAPPQDRRGMAERKK